MLLEVTDIQHGCTHDGPGLRTTVFLKGCPLHCKWCHNPETCSHEKELFFRPNLCIGCMQCVGEIGCPALITDKENLTEKGRPKAFIDQSLCTGCGLCTQICPADAIG